MHNELLLDTLKQKNLTATQKVIILAMLTDKTPGEEYTIDIKALATKCALHPEEISDAYRRGLKQGGFLVEDVKAAKYVSGPTMHLFGFGQTEAPKAPGLTPELAPGLTPELAPVEEPKAPQGVAPASVATKTKAKP
jgi:hypothetical protein